MRAATELVAEGVDVDGLIQLACQPTDVRAMDGYEVEILFRAALVEAGLQLPSRETAGWTIVRWIAATMIEGVISPGEGAGRIWGMHNECGLVHEVVEMLQLQDAWESSVGADRVAVEAEMLDFAPEVVAAADRHLAANRPPSSYA